MWLHRSRRSPRAARVSYNWTDRTAYCYMKISLFLTPLQNILRVHITSAPLLTLVQRRNTWTEDSQLGFPTMPSESGYKYPCVMCSANRYWEISGDYLFGCIPNFLLGNLDWALRSWIWPWLSPSYCEDLRYEPKVGALFPHPDNEWINILFKYSWSPFLHLFIRKMALYNIYTYMHTFTYK